MVTSTALSRYCFCAAAPRTFVIPMTSIGLRPALAVTGLHALDGARYLRDAQHADAMLCRLVAHHSCAIIEAEERGLADALSSEFDPAPYELASVLTCCDMTTSPDGELVPVDQAARRDT